MKTPLGRARFWTATPKLAVATAVALLLAGLVLGLYIERSYRTQKLQEVSAQARILAATSTAALAFNDPKAAQEYVTALKVNPEISAAGIYDAKGAFFAGFARNPAQQLAPTTQPAPPFFRDGRLVVSLPVQQGAATLGTVYLRAVTETTATRIERYSIIAVLVTLAALVVAVLGVAQAALTRTNAELQRRAADLGAANANLQQQIEGRMQAEEALRQAQKMEAIGQLTGGVAHDFNNILQVILGNLSLVKRRVETNGMAAPDDMRRQIAAAIRSGERAAVLTQRLLAFARRQPLAPQPLDVNKLVSGLSELLQRTLGEGVRIETVLAAGAWRISADSNQLENALLNLAVNARDAMPSGGKLTIETANAYLDEAYAAAHIDIGPGQYVAIAVSDTGEGMSKDILARAFEPFFTTKDVGQGTGLGLSQVYGFVKQSGGHVKIYSEPGEGTTVRLYLPRLTGVADQTPAAATDPRPLPRGTAAELILVVEDEPDVRAFSAGMLRELGYGVIEASDGQEALRLLGERPEIRLIFTDVGLPGGFTGRHLADEARRLRPELRVLYTTGYARNAIVHHGRLDPGVELLNKPFSYVALASKIRSILDRPA